jgi:endonuclease/exonuclease/phosphatase (EEP) superfamily protein YafD
VRSWLRGFIDALAWLSAAVAVLVLVLREISWGWQPTIVVTAFAPYFGLGAVLALALFLLHRRWIGVALSVAATVVLVVVELPLYLPTFDDGASHGAALTVLQANLRLGSADAAHLVRQVVVDHVAVLTVEELSPEEVARLDTAGIGAALPYRFVNPHEGGDGIGLFSRFPLTDEVYDGHDFGLGVESAQAAGPTGPMTVYAVHLTPPWPYPSHHWVSEIGRLRTMLRQAPASEPLIVGGDFNASYDNPQFRALLGSGIDDADRASGAGLLLTYPADRFYPPLLGIDHVLTRGLTATDVDTVTLTGSDHRGLRVRLSTGS